MSDIDASPNGLRKTQLVGGFRNTDPNDERVFNAASFAVNLLCSGEASDKSYSFASSLISYNQRKESGLLEEGNELKLEVVEVKQQVRFIEKKNIDEGFNGYDIYLFTPFLYFLNRWLLV